MKIQATLGWALVLASPCLAQVDKIDHSKVVQTTLSAIRHSPDTYKGVAVSFSVQFAALGRIHNPFFTRFVSTHFANFLAWGDEQPIWRKLEYDNVFPLLFVSKEHPQVGAVFKHQRYDRLRLIGVVRNTFQDRPWIEILESRRLPGKVNMATLTHLYRGEQYMAQRQWNQAISELSLAPVEGVPAAVRAAVHKTVGVCYLKIGEPGDAMGHLTAAQQLAKSDPEIVHLVKTATERPHHALDRNVNLHQIQDHERPLWEAFEDVAGPVSTPTPAPAPDPAPSPAPTPAPSR